MIEAGLGITVISGKSSLMWGMSQSGTVGKSSLWGIVCVCVCVCLSVCLGKEWLRKKSASLVFLNSKKEILPLIYFHKLSEKQIAALEKF